MLDTLIGWHCRTNLGTRFYRITFAETIAASTTGYAVTIANAQDGASTTGYAVTIANAQDGADKKSKLTGFNFIMTGMYSVCTTGFVDVKILPDNDTTAKFYVQAFNEYDMRFPSPVLLMSDLVLEFDNNEAHNNNVYIAFDGFWISESRLADFTILSELIPATLSAIDVQTFAIQGILEAMAAAEGVETPTPEWDYGATRTKEVCKEFCKREEGN
jgi:hypothetical protein